MKRVIFKSKKAAILSSRLLIGQCIQYWSLITKTKHEKSNTSCDLEANTPLYCFNSGALTNLMLLLQSASEYEIVSNCGVFADSWEILCWQMLSISRLLVARNILGNRLSTSKVFEYSSYLRVTNSNADVSLLTPLCWWEPTVFYVKGFNDNSLARDKFFKYVNNTEGSQVHSVPW